MPGSFRSLLITLAVSAAVGWGLAATSCASAPPPATPEKAEIPPAAEPGTKPGAQGELQPGIPGSTDPAGGAPAADTSGTSRGGSSAAGTGGGSMDGSSAAGAGGGSINGSSAAGAGGGSMDGSSAAGAGGGSMDGSSAAGAGGGSMGGSSAGGTSAPPMGGSPPGGSQSTIQGTSGPASAAAGARPPQTPEERRAALDKRLSDSLSSFDAKLRAEQQRIASERDGRQVAVTTISAPDADSGTGDASRQHAGGRSSHSGDLSRDGGDLKSDRAAGNIGVGGNGAVANEIPDGNDDDVVARRLRKAAEQETDPELKDKLWKEYVEYKKNMQAK